MTLDQTKIDELVARSEDHSCPDADGNPNAACVTLAAVANLPSRFGQFQVAGFYNNVDDKEHAAFIQGDVTDAEDVPVRLHSECLTGDAAGSLRCDCRDQLEASLNAVGQMERGIVVYLRQEGRGIGLTNKIRAYMLQDAGLDTVEANHALGFPDDTRNYQVAAHMLHSLGVRSVKLMTNNPKKVAGLEDNGIKVTERIPHIMEPTVENIDYLQTKADKSGHLIEFTANEHQTY